MRQYEVTIAMPVYNVAPYVEAALLSALNQTFRNIEYLIIDDKGEDGSMDIVRRVINAHSRKEDIRIIDQKYNQKTGAARNAGVDNAKGKYLFFLDSDDTISSDCIEILYNAMSQTPVDFVSASFVRKDRQGKIYPLCHYEKDIIIGYGKFSVFDYCYGSGNKIAVSLCNRLYDISFLRSNHIRCIPSQTHEDSWFTYQVLMMATSCRLLPNCTMFYTYNPNSSSATFSTGYSENTARQYADIQILKCNYIKPYVKNSFYRGALTDIMKMCLYHAYQIEISSQMDRIKKMELETILLNPPFLVPTQGNRSGCALKYFLYRFFYILPLAWRLALIRIGGSLKIKGILRRWMHF